MKKLIIFSLAIFGCTTQPAPVATPPAPQSEFRNLQVLPQTLTRDQLVAIMRSFTRGLGVRCDHCHVVTATQPRQEFDFPSDAKEKKRAARVMIQTVNELNRNWIPRVEAAAGEAPPAGGSEELRVTCWTCHRGKPEPEDPPPPPPPPPTPTPTPTPTTTG